MSPRARARVLKAKTIVQEATESKLMRWVVAMMPILTILVSGFAFRQARDAKEGVQEVGVAVAAVVMDDAEEAQEEVSLREEVRRLKRKVARLEQGGGKLESGARRARPATSDIRRAPTGPGPVDVITAPFKWLWSKLGGQ